ncbi:amino acid/peptide:H+ symporter [Litorimonas taeanensis]|uniref:Amino acid/peptide:H+ symporter n=1 Tax=Litorimonas taeanensis TaxID=568099 RepID=A0A420WE34_9PROT|nr:peptide MFS transporter [Litorimonas taeanensis]RKQ69277.1 amino acid/peptide:H+ symporter [Litorimonas taeanensis]
MVGNSMAAEPEKTFLGHPRGLIICFLTEMWERFSYYGMRGLLSLYLIQHFLFSDTEANLIYGGYIALVYIMSIVGGILSDKYLGQRKAVTFGAILLVAGHFGMAFEGSGSEETLSFNGGDYVIMDEGRDDRRKLYIEYEGETRRMVFDTDKFVNLGGQRLVPINDAGEGDYVINRTTRGLLQNACNVFGMACAGPNPSTEIVINGVEYPVEKRVLNAETGETAMFIAYNGQSLQFEETTSSDIVLLGTDSRDRIEIKRDANGAPSQVLAFENSEDKTADISAPYAVVNQGDYSTAIERQSLYVNILFFSLALIIAGVGFLKPNISTIVGDLYPQGDPRRDGGFTLFYMGINLGSFLATWSCGILGIVYGWAWGFGLAGIGMLLGLIVFQWGQKWLGDVAEPPSLEKLKEKVFGPISVEWACYLSAVIVVILCMALLNYADVIGPLAAFVGIAFFILFVVYSFVKLKGRERSRMWAALYFAVAQIPFWSLFEQAGSSLTLVTSRLVDTNIAGWDVPTPVFQSLNAGFIFIFAPIVAWLWVFLAKRKIEPSTPVKFAFGVFGAGLGYLVLVWGMKTVGPAAMTPVFFIFAIYWVHTMAELMLSPVGLSAMTKLAPARMVGLFMAAWFVYSGLGNALSGVIAAAAGAETVGGQIVDVAGAKANYIQVFSSIGYIGMGIGFLMLLISPLIKKWMDEEVELLKTEESETPVI